MTLTHRRGTLEKAKRDRMLRELQEGASAQGNRFLEMHLSGDRLTQRQAIIAQCYFCMGYYVDGRRDCGCEECPLYPYMPYKSKESKNVGS